MSTSFIAIICWEGQHMVTGQRLKNVQMQLRELITNNQPNLNKKGSETMKRINTTSQKNTKHAPTIDIQGGVLCKNDKNRVTKRRQVCGNLVVSNM